MVIVHSYVSLLEGKPPFSYGFPMVFPWLYHYNPSLPSQAAGLRQNANVPAIVDVTIYEAMLAAAMEEGVW